MTAILMHPHMFLTEGARLFAAHVSAAKAGVDALSNVIAAEEGPRGIRSNVIAPVSIPCLSTRSRPMILTTFLSMCRLQGPILGTEGMDRLTPKAMSDAISKQVPLQRQGAIDDIANASVFLFSEAANWINGQVIVRIYPLLFPQRP
jgi:peroxisomal 2,4-dienoyl-CoA reductase